MDNSVSPRILITTSRNPTQRIRTFCNDLTRAIPGSLKISRGKSSLTNLAEKALEHETKRVTVVERWKSNLGKIRLFILGDAGLVQFYPVIYMRNVKLRTSFGDVQTETGKELTIQTDTEISFQTRKLAHALSDFLDISKLSTSEMFTPSTQRMMHISHNTAHRIQIKFLQGPQETEIGPRITISHLVWK